MSQFFFQLSQSLIFPHSKYLLHCQKNLILKVFNLKFYSLKYFKLTSKLFDVWTEKSISSIITLFLGDFLIEKVPIMYHCLIHYTQYLLSDIRDWFQS